MSAASRQAPPAKVDAKTAVKIVASVLLALGAVGALFYFSMQSSMELYRHVDEVQAKAAEYDGKRLQVHGFVSSTVEKSRDGTKFRWDLESRAPRGPGLVKIRYTGSTIPDTLKKDAEVVATGKLTREGSDLVLLADNVTAQCPSKYNEAPKLKGVTGQATNTNVGM